MSFPLIFQRGEDIRIFLAVSGSALEVQNVVSVSADLKRALAGNQVPPESAPVVLAFAVTPELSPPSGSPLGWYLSLSAAEVAPLQPGNFVTNAVIVYADSVVEITDALFVTIQQSTAP